MKEETKQMGLMKKLTSALVASSLVFSLVGTAAAAYTPAAGETAAKRMQDLKLVAGRPDGSLGLNDSITRAELVTVIDRAFGQEENAKLLKGSTAFTDISTHWASGNIAMAAALAEKAGGDKIGFEDGSFKPDAKLTPAQAVAFLMKFVGVKADAAKAWPANYLDVAVEKNIITAEDKALIAPMLNENATRGLVFYMFDRAFANFTLATGKTFYTQYVDTMAPVITLNAVEATTNDSKITISGNVKDATEVYVGTTKVTTDATGNFSVAYDLPELKEYNITVTARDLAGNTAEKAAKVTRQVGAAAAIEASDITVAAGATAEVKATVKDAKGNAVAAAITGESTVGTFADGKFTAGTKAGAGTLTLKSGELTKTVNVTVTAGALAKVVADKTSVNKGEIVTLTAQDANGNAITGVTYSQTSADAMIDATTGKFLASKAGSYTVTAKAGDATATITIGVFGSATKLAISAPAQIVANGSTKYDVTVTAVDANGNVVTTNESTFKLAASGLTIYDKDGAGAAANEKSASTTTGSYTFKVVAPAGWAGQIQDLTATDTTTDRTTKLTETSATSELVGQVATAVKVSAASDYLTANTQADSDEFVTVKVVDQKGVKMANGTYEAKVTVSGPATIESPTSAGTYGTSYTYTVVSGQVKVNVRNQQGVTGAVTFTATVDGVGTANANVTSAFAGVAKLIKVAYSKASDNTVAVTEAVKAGVGVHVAATITDANGVPVAYNGTLTVTPVKEDTDVKLVAAGTTGAATASTTSLTEVTVTDGAASFDLITKGAYTGTYEIKLDNKTGSAALDVVTAAVSVKANDYTHLSLTRGQQTIKVPVGNATTNLTAQLYDAYNNKVAVSGVKLTFQGYNATDDTLSSAVTLNGTAKEIEVTTDATGAATVAVAVRPYTSAGALGTYYVTVNGEAADETALTARTNTAGDDLNVAFVDAAAQTATSIAVSYMRPSYTVATVTTNAAPVTSLYLQNDGTTYENQLIVKAVVKDNYGQLLDNEEANLKLVADEAVLWKVDELVNATDYGTVTWYGYGDTLPAGFDGVTIGHGEYFAIINVGKAGMLNLGVKDVAGATDVAQTKGLLVNAAAASKVVVTEANSDNKIQVKKNTVAGPFTLQLTDDYGNFTTSNVKKAVTVTGIDTRLSAGDVSVGSLETYNNVKFYVTTTNTSDFTVTFGGDATGSVIIDVVD